MSEPEYSKIEGLRPREPVGAVLSIGRKGPSGAPQDTDRFWIVSPQEANGVRPLHPGFEHYNKADPEKRLQIRGNLVHAMREEAFGYYLSAQVLGQEWPAFPGTHPARRPICTGDGIKATRFYGLKPDGSDDFREIECPNEKCQFRQGDTKVCRPFGRLYFRPLWKEGSSAQTPLMKLATHSWNTIQNLVGFFDHVESQAKNLGLTLWTLYGLPFVLTLARKTQPGRKRAFPVLTISPECDLIQFFLIQRRDLLAAGSTLALPVGATSVEETDPEVVDADSRAIRPGGPVEKPASALPMVETDGTLFDEVR